MCCTRSRRSKDAQVLLIVDSHEKKTEHLMATDSARCSNQRKAISAAGLSLLDSILDTFTNETTDLVSLRGPSDPYRWIVCINTRNSRLLQLLASSFTDQQVNADYGGTDQQHYPKCCQCVLHSDALQAYQLPCT